jgi:hypothetical protein
MKPRHAAALALVGWYLMILPLDHSEEHFLVDAPLSQWRMTYALDSANECERWLNDLRNDAKKDENEKLHTWFDAKKAGREPTDSQTQEVAKSLSIAVASGQMMCIASDDPRLKEK